MPTQISSPSLPRRTVWTGYVACAWALLFALEHIYWACGGSLFVGEADVRENMSQFAHNPWRYVLSWALLSGLFAILALFPLALVWPGQWLSRRSARIIAVTTGYVGIILMATYSFATGDNQTGLASLGISALGLAVALVRPRGQSIAHWMTLVAAWIFGAGMTIYGCCYTIFALSNIHAASFMAYLCAGGINWFVEGALFLAIAWLISRNGHHARRSAARQPA